MQVLSPKEVDQYQQQYQQQLLRLSPIDIFNNYLKQNTRDGQCSMPYGDIIKLTGTFEQLEALIKAVQASGWKVSQNGYHYFFSSI